MAAAEGDSELPVHVGEGRRGLWFWWEFGLWRVGMLER